MCLGNDKTIHQNITQNEKYINNLSFMFNMTKIDNKDLKILHSLDFNSRMSFSQLAKRLQMKKETLIYRIKNLEKENIIENYFVVPNTPKLGLVSFKILIKYQNLTNNKETEIIEYLKNIDEVGWIVKTEGVYDLMCIVWIKNEITFDNFWSKFLNNYSKYFNKKEFLILTENHAYKKDYLIKTLNNNSEEVFYRGEAINECDEIDNKIIYELSKDGRISAMDLTKKINLTPEAISNRIRLLKKKNILQTFRPKINLNKIGYIYYNILINIKDFSIISKLLFYASTQKNITYFVKYLGKYEVGMDIEVLSPNKFRKIIEEIRNQFGENITNYDFVRIIDEEKITYGPKL